MFDHFVDTRRYRVKNCHGKSIKIAWLCFFSKFPLLLIMNISGLADFGGPCYTYTTWNLYRQVWKFPLFRKLRGKQVLFLYPQYVAVTLNILIKKRIYTQQCLKLASNEEVAKTLSVIRLMSLSMMRFSYLYRWSKRSKITSMFINSSYFHLNICFTFSLHLLETMLVFSIYEMF